MFKSLRLIMNLCYATPDRFEGRNFDRSLKSLRISSWVSVMRLPNDLKAETMFKSLRISSWVSVIRLPGRYEGRNFDRPFKNLRISVMRHPTDLKAETSIDRLKSLQIMSSLVSLSNLDDFESRKDSPNWIMKWLVPDSLWRHTFSDRRLPSSVLLYDSPSPNLSFDSYTLTDIWPPP